MKCFLKENIWRNDNKKVFLQPPCFYGKFFSFRPILKECKYTQKEMPLKTYIEDNYSD